MRWRGFRWIDSALGFNSIQIQIQIPTERGRWAVSQQEEQHSSDQLLHHSLLFSSLPYQPGLRAPHWLLFLKPERGVALPRNRGIACSAADFLFFFFPEINEPEGTGIYKAASRRTVSHYRLLSFNQVACDKFHFTMQPLPSIPRFTWSLEALLDHDSTAG